MNDVLGKALLDYHNGNYAEDITTFSSLDERDVLPLPYLFRTFDAMPDLEQQALLQCKGKILDVGCGAGSHSLYLQEKGFDVTALDISKGAVEVCKMRGVDNLVHSSILKYSGTKFDTLLLLMNGIGIVGRLEQLPNYLNHFKKLLNFEGNILLDSSDIIYMYDKDEDGGYWVPEHVDYYGEIEFIMEYKGLKSNPFHWLYLDYKTLENVAESNDFDCKIVSRGTHYDYLALLTLKT